MSSETHGPAQTPPPPQSQTQTQLRPQPSALSTLLNTSGAKTPSEAVPLEILHNLQHQHAWTGLKLHVVHVNAGTSANIHIVSGVPPRHSYVHPDLTMQLVKHGMAESAIPVQREFVLPLAVGDSWTLKRFCAVFDALPTRDVVVVSPPSSGPAHPATAGTGGSAETNAHAPIGLGVTSHPVDIGERHSESSPLAASSSPEATHRPRPHHQHHRLNVPGGSNGNSTAVANPSPTGYHHQDQKRVLLGMKARTGGGGDSTVVYYIMQEGEIKPRQNG